VETKSNKQNSILSLSYLISVSVDNFDFFNVLIHFSFSLRLVSVQQTSKMSPVKLEVVDTQYGIPYMKAPIGKLRFRDAQPPETWSEPFDATQEPSSYCISNFLNYKIEGKEDAGVINVYTPYLKTEKPLPVMVWIHGGGFYSGIS
jgi:carboxylesterase type B